jgi:hypothetical protein
MGIHVASITSAKYRDILIILHYCHYSTDCPEKLPSNRVVVKAEENAQ